MHVVRLEIDPNDAIAHKTELLHDGLVMDVDFAWSYHQSKWSTEYAVESKHAMFEFKNAALATFYKLKWTNRND